jgi:Domain of unknown function (DUF4124)
MKKISLIIAVGLLFYSAVAFGQEVYRWVDEKGVVHFTDDLGQIPEKYRGQFQRVRPPDESPPVQPTSPPSIGTPKGTPGAREIRPTPGSATGEKDILGRGEEWWRAKMREWNEKLINAQKSYESTYSEWKAKEQEIETSKFKPDSLKRKLKAESIALEEKAKDLGKQVEEAKNMIEKVLPKQAQEDGANPEWLKIEK